MGALLGLIAFTATFILLATFEAVGLYKEYTGKWRTTDWQTLTTYIQHAPRWFRWSVLAFCTWLVYHFGSGLAW